MARAASTATKAKGRMVGNLTGESGLIMTARPCGLPPCHVRKVLARPGVSPASHATSSTPSFVSWERSRLLGWPSARLHDLGKLPRKSLTRWRFRPIMQPIWQQACLQGRGCCRPSPLSPEWVFSCLLQCVQPTLLAFEPALRAYSCLRRSGHGAHHGGDPEQELPDQLPLEHRAGRVRRRAGLPGRSADRKQRLGVTPIRSCPCLDASACRPASSATGAGFPECGCPAVRDLPGADPSLPY